MARFVLIHGSGENARCWERVGRRLRADGHEFVSPELPKSAPDLRLEDFASEIAAATATGDIVVAHSFSGVLLPLVVRHRDVSLLVFLAAVIPEPGQSVRGQFTADPTMFCPEWIAAGPRWFDPAQRQQLAEEFLFHDCAEETFRWALGTVDLFDTRHLVTEPAPFDSWPDVRAASIVATGDRTLSPDWGRRITRRVLGAEPIEIDAGHCPHVSRPGQVAEILEGLAASGA